MPRYFFEIEVPGSCLTPVRLDLPDLIAARAFAQDFVTIHQRETGAPLAADKSRLRIKNEAGSTIDTLVAASK